MATCSEPALNARIAGICFDDADDKDRSALEEHLLVCDECWHEFRRISEAVQVLRSDRALVEPVIAADLIQLAGLGARLHRWLGGHAVIGASIALGFGLMTALALLVEVAYQWDKFSAWVPYIALIVGLGSSTVCLLALDLVRRRVAAGGVNSLFWGVSPIVAWAAVAGVTVAWFLPTDPIVVANFQTMTARVGWIKSILQALEVPLLALIPFQFVLAMQHELWCNRIDHVLKVLTNDPLRVTPRGTLFIRPVLAAAVFVLFAIWWILGNAHLLDNLVPAPHLGLFMGLAIARMLTVLLTLFAVLVWYARTLNEVKRQAIAILTGRRALETR